MKKDVFEEQDSLLKKQEEHLELLLEEGLTPLKEKLITISNEINEQDKIIDIVDEDTTRVGEGLREQSEKSKQVSEVSSVWRLQCVSLILFVVLVFLILNKL
eukprot:snap_masked-scaffold_72-processed-gene-0.15-mRNA-1 protein AED:1.00 eAED:1.00 QI:0/0/0/0/1/1/2/0/101